jgi:membrane associated rhomboid family serine protease
MSEAPAPYLTESDPTDAPRITPAVQWIIGLNIVVYFLQVTIVQPADLQSALGFEPARFPAHWWGILTYAFAHGGFWHIALNLYTLWIFGPRVEHAWSAAEFTRFYLLCALGGSLTHFAFVRDGGVLIGASAAVLGVMVAYAARWPNDEVYLFGVIPVKVRWLVVGLVVVNLLSGLASDGAGVAYLAHVGGIVAAWLYLRTMHFSAERVRSHVATAPDYPEDGPRPVPRGSNRPREPRTETDDIVAKSRAILGAPIRRPIATGKSEPKRREALDRVLDKIAATGMQSLTSDERRVLDEESKRLRLEP